jgi:D-alanine-D-alanine ligase
VQGFLELANIPYVGAGVLGSALGMDKGKMKEVLRYHGLPVPDWVAFRRWQWGQEREAVLRAASGFGFPCFVKPANLGSSVGISKAHTPDELPAAIAEAFRHDEKILVEPFVDGREIEVAVLGNHHPRASVPGEIVPCNEFYDYRAKYLDGRSELHIPAPISAAQAQRCRDLAVAAFLALECSGLARVDFFLHRHSGEVLLNEINTLPGFTPISMYPKLWEASGVSYSQLIDRLLQLAVERWQERTGAPTERDDR